MPNSDEKVILSRYDDIWLATTRGYSHYAKAFGLSDTALDVLYLLDHAQGGAMTQSMVVKMTGYSKQLVSSVVKDFIRLGYIATEVAPDDRRRKSLVLTEVGKQFAARVMGPLDEVDTKIRALVSDEQWDYMMSLADSYVAFLEEAVQQAERLNKRSQA